MTTKTNNLTKLIDDLGRIKAQIAELQLAEKAMKENLEELDPAPTKASCFASQSRNRPQDPRHGRSARETLPAIHRGPHQRDAGSHPQSIRS